MMTTRPALPELIQRDLVTLKRQEEASKHAKHGEIQLLKVPSVSAKSSAIHEEQRKLAEFCKANSSSNKPAQKKVLNQLNFLEKDYLSKVNAIRNDAMQEKRNLLRRLEIEKQKVLSELEIQEDQYLTEAKEDYEQQRITILSNVRHGEVCSGCARVHKVLAATCTECKSVQLCASCLASKIDDSCKCSNCGVMTNMICKACQVKKLREVGWFEYEKCREGCGYLCPEHQHVISCQSCGYQCFCNGPHRTCRIVRDHSGDLLLCTKCRKLELTPGTAQEQGCFWRIASRRNSIQHSTRGDA